MPLLIRIWRGHYKSKRLEKPCNKWIFSTIDSSLLLRYTQIGWSHCPYKSTKMNTEAKSKTRNKIWSKGNKLVDRLFLRKIKIHISCELKQTLPQQGIIEAEGFFLNSRTNSMWGQKKVSEKLLTFFRSQMLRHSSRQTQGLWIFRNTARWVRKGPWMLLWPHSRGCVLVLHRPLYTTPTDVYLTNSSPPFPSKSHRGIWSTAHNWGRTNSR